MKTITSGEHTFTIVQSIPKNYMIWNIGKNMVDGYLPLCTLAKRQPFEGAQCIDVESLKAIKIDEAQIILAAIGGGQNTIGLMEKYIKRYKNAKCGTYEYAQVQRMTEALPIMKKIKWN